MCEGQLLRNECIGHASSITSALRLAPAALQPAQAARRHSRRHNGPARAAANCEGLLAASRGGDERLIELAPSLGRTCARQQIARWGQSGVLYA